MDLLLVVFVLFVVFYIKPLQWHEQNEDYLEVKNCNRLRGIMSLTIILHHLSEHITSGNLFRLMQHMGYLIVAVFFLLSGYGLMTQYRKKGYMYLTRFWKKRILFFAIILLIDTGFYWIVNLIDGKFISFKTVIHSSIHGDLIAGSAWYLVALILFYIFFWVSFKLFSNRCKSILVLILFVTAYTVSMIIAAFPSFWFYSNFAFVFGILLAEYKKPVLALLRRHYLLALTIILSGFVTFSILPRFESSIYTICRIISGPLFTLLVFLMMGKINIKNGIWDIVNLYSLELFLLHAAVYRFLRGNTVFISNDVIYCLSVIAISFMIAIPAHLINEKIREKLK